MRDPVRECWPVDELEDERANAIRFFEAVDGRDVRMIQRSEDVCFTFEAGEAVGIGGEGLGQNFDCDVAIELRVARAIDLAL